MEQKKQILSRFNITIYMLLEYYTNHVRKSIYKSLMRKYLKDLHFDESLISSIIIIIIIITTTTARYATV